ncbi:MAG: hypothetical protein P1P86_12645 [Bacteroidales bacterium]|nr:hypothetical protein [Bacteroidales bacterium]
MNNTDIPGNSNVVNVFWTSGVDSTFRIIQLLLTSENTVQPHYLVRYESSTGIEIDTMIYLRRMIVRKYPEVGSRFLPTIYVNEGLIPRDEDVIGHINELRNLDKVTEQYDVMSCYCKAFDIEEIEVALTRVTRDKPFFKDFEKCKAFTPFRYPTINLTKKEMFSIARKGGWHEILIRTSFCHRPKKKISPCGTCGPCSDAVMAGMGFRFPLFTRMKAWLVIPLRKFWRKNYHRQDSSKVFRYIKRKFEHKY